MRVLPRKCCVIDMKSRATAGQRTPHHSLVCSAQGAVLGIICWAVQWLIMMAWGRVHHSVGNLRCKNYWEVQSLHCVICGGEQQLRYFINHHHILPAITVPGAVGKLEHLSHSDRKDTVFNASGRACYKYSLWSRNIKFCKILVGWRDQTIRTILRDAETMGLETWQALTNGNIRNHL